MPSEVELAWAAGIIDGEGCIHIAVVGFQRNKRGYHQLSVDVGNTSLVMVERLKSLFDGLMYYPYAKDLDRNPTHKPRYQFRVNGKKAVAMLNAIMPYMVVKYGQAALAVKVFEDVPDRDVREAARISLQEMKG